MLCPDLGFFVRGLHNTSHICLIRPWGWGALLFRVLGVLRCLLGGLLLRLLLRFLLRQPLLLRHLRRLHVQITALLIRNNVLERQGNKGRRLLAFLLSNFLRHHRRDAVPDRRWA